MIKRIARFMPGATAPAPNAASALQKAAAPAVKPLPFAQRIEPLLITLEQEARKLATNISTAFLANSPGSGSVVLHVYRSNQGLDLLMLREEGRSQSYPMALSFAGFEDSPQGPGVNYTVKGQAASALAPTRPVLDSGSFALTDTNKGIRVMTNAVLSQLSMEERALLDRTIWPKSYSGQKPAPRT